MDHVFIIQDSVKKNKSTGKKSFPEADGSQTCRKEEDGKFEIGEALKKMCSGLVISARRWYNVFESV
jgi:hypothetical protein